MEVIDSQLPPWQGTKEFHPLGKQSLYSQRKEGIQDRTLRVKDQLHNILHFMGAATLMMNGGKRLNANASHFFRDIVVDVLQLVDVKQVHFQEEVKVTPSRSI